MFEPFPTAARCVVIISHQRALHKIRLSESPVRAPWRLTTTGAGGRSRFHVGLYQTGQGGSQCSVTLFPDVPVGPPRCNEFSNVVSVGIDLIHVSDVRRSIEKFGERYLRRLFTLKELSDCMREADPAPRLAARFAAKEATIKALRLDGFQPAWTSMELWRHPVGWCDEMSLSGSAAVWAAERGIWKIKVSLSHEADDALAVVIATKAPAYGSYL